MNTAIIGTGFMGSNHARVYSEISNLIAVCDIDRERANGIARKYNCKAYTNYIDMVDSEAPDMVSVVVPTKFHHKVAMDIISAGIPVMIEKPIASTIEQAKEIVQAARNHGVKVLVGHIERFNPVVQTAKNIVDEGLIGKMLELRGVRVGPFTPRVKDAGVLHILAIHDLDLFQYIVNDKIKDLWCTTVERKFSKFEDIAKVMCKFGNGVIGSLDVSWTSPKKIRSLTITGTEGILELDYLTQKLILTEKNTPRSVKDYSEYLQYNVTGEERHLSVVKEEPLKVELKHFLDCVENNKEPLMNAQAGLEALELVEKCLAIMK